MVLASTDVNKPPSFGITIVDNTMLEKSSRIVLTKDDLDQYNAGKVSDRLKSAWSLDFQSLQEIVESQNFILVDHE